MSTAHTHDPDIGVTTTCIAPQTTTAYHLQQSKVFVETAAGGDAR